MFVISVTTDDVTEHGFSTTHPDFAKFLVRVTYAVAWASHDPGPRCLDGFSFVDDDMFVHYWPLKDSASTSGTSTVSDSPLHSTDSAPQCMLRLTHRGQHWTQAESDVSALAYLLEKHFFHRKCPFAGNYCRQCRMTFLYLQNSTFYHSFYSFMYGLTLILLLHCDTRVTYDPCTFQWGLRTCLPSQWCRLIG